jgi:hypothetical protein
MYDVVIAPASSRSTISYAGVAMMRENGSDGVMIVQRKRRASRETSFWGWAHGRAT